MSYGIRLHPKVEKFVGRCPRELSTRIIAKVRALKEEPFRYLEHYAGADCHKLRIGDYRALIDVDVGRKIIFVHVLDHSSRIYKRN